MTRLFPRLCIALSAAALAIAAIVPLPQSNAACCYFSAKDKDVSQPGQKAFITWDPEAKKESFTVQPKFEGNASDFGMVIPTPARPKLDEMPRDFFKELAVFTILEPMDMSKYKNFNALFAASAGGARFEDAIKKEAKVVVLEAGIVGSLDYKIVEANDATALFDWLKANQYTFSGDQATLDYYIQKKWYFTTMKIDPKQMKKRADGSFEGEITPTRFAFESNRLIYPLKITRLSVKDKTEALFYVQAPQKMDLPEDFSWQFTFEPMWSQALSFAVPEKVTAQEKAWREVVTPKLESYAKTVNQQQQVHGRVPATLEWAKKIGDADISVLLGDKPYNREAPKEDVEKLKLLKGHVQKGKWITKIRKSFSKEEMEDDLVFVKAAVDGKADEMEYVSILPTSPP